MKTTDESTVAWGRFKRLLDYYIDCVRNDEGYKANLYLSKEDNLFLPLSLEKEWSQSEQAILNIALSGNRTTFAKNLRQKSSSAALFYGYPIFVKWIEKSKRGWTGGFLKPVFLQPVDYRLQGTDLEIALSQEQPMPNPEFMKSLFRTPEEIREFLQLLGLTSTDEGDHIVAMSELVQRLLEFGGKKDVIEELDPDHLQDTPSISSLTTTGFYNRAVLVMGERPPYTRGLEKELPMLRAKWNTGVLSQTALRPFFEQDQPYDEQPLISGENQRLVEVVPLNDQQREAVEATFSNSLTVVTGPPGTGKSQIVLSVLANAYLNGQRVLFSSRNNKAVDVVETRINGLSRFPLLIRAGTKVGERNVKAELLEYLTQILSISTSDEERLAEKETAASYNNLYKERLALWEELENARQARNEADRLDRKLEGVRSDLPEDVWKSLEQLDEVPEGANPADIIRLLNYHAKPSPNPLARILRRFRWKRDRKRIGAYVKASRLVSDTLKISAVSEIESDNFAALREIARGAEDRFQILRLRKDHRSALNKIQEFPTTDVFAERLQEIEERLWDSGQELIMARSRLVSDGLSSEQRRAIGNYRAALEMLATNKKVRGPVYRKVVSEMHRLFGKVTEVLPIWCVTNLSAHGSLPFNEALFDLVVIDEASQCDIPSALPLLFRAKRALIIGDPQQLRHISNIPSLTEERLAMKHGLDPLEDQRYTFPRNSLFDLSASAGEAKVISLREHFRSRAEIVGFSNRFWYGNSLVIATDYRRLKRVKEEIWGIKWTNVKSTVQRPSSGSALCLEEVEAVVTELKSLLEDRSFEGTVGVVSPFRAQANRIRDVVNNTLDLSLIERSNLIVDTAHGFQGDERDVVLFSPCIGVGMPSRSKGFIESTGNLFNVALTRARSLLHVVGDQAACMSCRISYVEEFAKYVVQRKVFSPPVIKAPGSKESTVGFWERPFYEALKKAGVQARPQFPVYQYILDFAVIDGDLKLDIEIDGELYHKEWDGKRARHDVIRDMRLQALGWQIKRFWVYRIRDEMEECVTEVLQVLEDRETNKSVKVTT